MSLQALSNANICFPKILCMTIFVKDSCKLLEKIGIVNLVNAITLGRTKYTTRIVEIL